MYLEQLNQRNKKGDIYEKDLLPRTYNYTYGSYL